MENIIIGTINIPLNQENNSASYCIPSTNSLATNINYFPEGLVGQDNSSNSLTFNDMKK
ncbi:hypothetical protein SDC9_97683 [bioreactor metagenome]|uniref:Uncharacterized protein n=1 Tax=bioreactor metagenome TaxID=1076179 RepID=A0A645AD38_9ZZZZ